MPDPIVMAQGDGPRVCGRGDLAGDLDLVRTPPREPVRPGSMPAGSSASAPGSTSDAGCSASSRTGRSGEDLDRLLGHRDPGRARRRAAGGVPQGTAMADLGLADDDRGRPGPRAAARIDVPGRPGPSRLAGLAAGPGLADPRLDRRGRVGGLGPAGPAGSTVARGLAADDRPGDRLGRLGDHDHAVRVWQRRPGRAAAVGGDPGRVGRRRWPGPNPSDRPPRSASRSSGSRACWSSAASSASCAPITPSSSSPPRCWPGFRSCRACDGCRRGAAACCGVFLVGAVVSGVLADAARRFIGGSEATATGSKEPSVQDYMDYGR